MQVQMAIEIKDFMTPNFVTTVGGAGTRQEGFNPQEGIPLKDLGTDTLDQLCRNFRREVFRKAEKQDPQDK